MTAPTLTEFADRLGQIIPVMMKDFARRQMGELFKVKITFPQFFILQFLHIEGESKMTDMARFMNVTTAAMTGLADRLVKSGYVKRIYDPDDRRVIKIELTANGEEIVKNVNQHRRQMIIKMFGKISGADRMNYLRILTQIKETLTNGIDK